MAKQYFIPGFGVINETTVIKQFLIPGFGIISILVSSGSGGGGGFIFDGP